MRKTILVFISVFIFLSAHSAKQTATFTFENWNGKQPPGDNYSKMTVVVNGLKIEKQDKPYTIKLNANVIDTIKVEGVYGKHTYTILTKLKAGEKYRLVINPCSAFEIRPSNDTLARTQLIRVITVNKDDKPLFFDGDYFYSETMRSFVTDTSAYCRTAYSGMCPFASSSFYMCTEDPGYEKKADTAICNTVRIQYFSTEMFSILYDCKTKRMNVKFDGYYDKAKKILIKEN